VPAKAADLPEMVHENIGRGGMSRLDGQWETRVDVTYTGIKATGPVDRYSDAIHSEVFPWLLNLPATMCSRA
jgi:hypothetical protein